jgi:hypothetical protein
MGPQSVPRRPLTKREKAILAFAAVVLEATLFAILSGMDTFLFSTNPFVFVPVGLAVGIVTVKMSEKIKLLALGAFAGVLGGGISLFISGVERSLLVWTGVSIAALIIICLALYPRTRQRFTRATLFLSSFGTVFFMAMLVLFATFLFPIPFLSLRGVQASFATANSPSNRKLLLDYTVQINDSAEGLNYLQLLNWTRRHLAWGTATSKTNPLEILKIGRGACEDYARVYVGLLLVNNYTARLILDCSYSWWPIKEAGNHSWAEVLINGTWVPVDASLDPSYGVNNSYLYARGWNKTMNHIIAITENDILDVTPSYIPPS